MLANSCRKRSSAAPGKKEREKIKDTTRPEGTEARNSKFTRRYTKGPEGRRRSLPRSPLPPPLPGAADRETRLGVVPVSVPQLCYSLRSLVRHEPSQRQASDERAREKERKKRREGRTHRKGSFVVNVALDVPDLMAETTTSAVLCFCFFFTAQIARDNLIDERSTIPSRVLRMAFFRTDGVQCSFVFLLSVIFLNFKERVYLPFGRLETTVK